MNNISELHSQRVSMEQITRLCEPFLQYIYDDTVEEIHLNADGKLIVETTDRGKIYLKETMAAPQAKQLLGNIASYNGHDLTKRPLMETQFPLNGGRFSACAAPYSQPGLKHSTGTSATNAMPSFSLRCGGKKIYPVNLLVESKMIEPEVEEIFRRLILERKTIIVAGATGSGKTSLLNTLLMLMAEIAPDDRVIIITDIDDVICYSKDVNIFMADGRISMKDLGVHTLRRTPKRIVFGEVRAGEALQAIIAWDTGHSGLLTLHSESGSETPDRLRMAAMMGSNDTTSLPDSEELSKRIAKAIDAVVYVQKDSSCKAGRRVLEVTEVLDYDIRERKFITNDIYRYKGNI